MSRKKQLGPLSRALLRLPVPWVFVLTYLAGAGLESILHYGEFTRHASVTAAGGILFLIGAALAAWGWWMFHRAKTTRVPGEASTTLVTWGPYRFTRNPMYVGLTIAYLGEAGILHHIIPVILLPLTLVYVNQVVIPVEEERLHEVFGAEYKRYCGRVRRWL